MPHKTEKEIEGAHVKGAKADGWHAVKYKTEQIRRMAQKRMRQAK